MATSFIPSKPMASEIRSDPIPNSRLFTGIEASLLLVAFGVLWAALYWFAKGGPVSTDVLYYFQLGQLRIADPFVLNRYFHILFQKLFVDLSANPLAGIQSLWAFLTSLSTVGVYLIARLATRRSTQLHGLMAVAIFFSLPSLPKVAGVTHVDLMTMTMSVLLVVLYLFSLNKKHDNKALLIALGVVTFLGLKTKENFISSTVVLIGLFWVGDKFNFRIGMKRILFFLVGGLTAAIILQLSCWLVLGQPLFGLRPQDIQVFLNTYANRGFVSSTRVNTSHTNIYSQFIFIYLANPFILYVMSMSATKEMKFPRKVVWLVPIIFLVMMVYLIKYLTVYNHRFFLPLLPFVSALAPQFILLAAPNARPTFKNQLLHLLVGILGAGLMFALKTLIIRVGQDSALYMDVIILPITLTLIFIVQIALNRGLQKSLLQVALLFALLMPPIQDNLRALLMDQLNYRVFTSAALPLTELGKVVDFKSDPVVAIEKKAVFTESVSFYKDLNEVSALYNLTNDTYTSKNDFKLLTEEAHVQAILSCQEKYSYVLLSEESWSRANTPRCIVDNYEIDQKSIANTVLLIQR